MKKYEPVQINVIRVQSEDIITVSVILDQQQYIEGSDSVQWGAPVFE